VASSIRRISGGTQRAANREHLLLVTRELCAQIRQAFLEARKRRHDALKRPVDAAIGTTEGAWECVRSG
jgi:hypothetical protein